MKITQSCTSNGQTNHSTEKVGTNLNANRLDPDPEITLEEITTVTAISTSKNKKSPGPDLITNEVLKSLPTTCLIPIL